jgi:hypothetical protein
MELKPCRLIDILESQQTKRKIWKSGSRIYVMRWKRCRMSGKKITAGGWRFTRLNSGCGKSRNRERLVCRQFVSPNPL